MTEKTQNEVLSFVNGFRVANGKSELKELPTGVPLSPTHCSLARAIGEGVAVSHFLVRHQSSPYVDYKHGWAPHPKYALKLGWPGSWTERIIRLVWPNGRKQKIDNEAVRNFIISFDKGDFPELIMDPSID